MFINNKLILIFFIYFFKNIKMYEIPKARIEIFYPKGFEVSIPADDGVTLFAFHGKLNEEMEGLEAGYWSKDITKAKNGRFTFRDRITSIKIGDILYYWTYALHNGLGYREDNGVYIVKKYSNIENELSSATISTTTPIPIQRTTKTKYRPIYFPIDKCENLQCDESITIVNGLQVQCKNQLIFEENFNNNILNSSVWKLEHRFSSEPDYEFVLYHQNSSALKLQNGILKIKPIKLVNHLNNKDISTLKFNFNFGFSCTGEYNTDDCFRNQHYYDILPPMVSAQISTINNFNFKYGKIEIRAKLPKGDWVFPQLWLQPTTYSYGQNDYRSGQMRIAFMQGNNPCIVNGGLILGSKEPLRTYKFCSKICSYTDNWTKDFHLYTLEWKNYSIRLLIDNDEYCNIIPGENGFHSLKIGNKVLPNAYQLSKGSNIAPFDKDFHIRIGYGIGGHHDFDDEMLNKPWKNFNPQSNSKFWKRMENRDDWLSDTDEESELHIDYIKIFSI
ncbi:gram-negative bacteria-binding protein 3-like [Condylostylus longicornis]|uniref:gram-negative bacteria-binding protein 3-like n=1 Tax=Condylostylus longicornis TaxID=2530218 RepID=UPI00244DA0BB|nr:gram-negative bacteria-binding protein 3-like [Condylostylus longicornis]